MIEYQSKENLTPVLVAAKFNNMSLFKYLVRRDANFHMQCIKMQNSLHYAVLNKSKAFIEYLIALDADKGQLRHDLNVRGKKPQELDTNHFFENELFSIFDQIREQHATRVKDSLKTLGVKATTILRGNTLLHIAI